MRGDSPEADLDLRIHAVQHERGVVEPALAGQFPEYRALTPRPAFAAAQFSFHAHPDPRSPQVTEALHGERLELLETLPGGWAWLRTVHDGYLGYARTDGLSFAAPARPLRVQAPRAHLYPTPGVKLPPLERVSAGAVLDALDEEPVQHGEYLWWRVAGRGGEGYLHAAAAEPPWIQEPAGWTEGRLASISAYLGTPYLWGGRSAWGLDCSGLTQLYAGHDAQGRSRLPRDADQQQAATLPVSSPERGDLAFFPGHVGLMLDERRLLHANATHLRVSVEALGEGDYGRRLAAAVLGFGRLRT